MEKVYIVRNGEKGNKISFVTTDKNKAINYRDSLQYIIEMGGGRGTAWIEEHEVN